MGHILNPDFEFSPIFDQLDEQFLDRDSKNTADFWQQHFQVQDLTEKVQQHAAQLSVDITNHHTGETFHFDNISLKGNGEARH